MGLYGRVAREGLNAAECDAVLRAELKDYRDGLRQMTAKWWFQPAWATLTDVDADVLIHEKIRSAFAMTGIVDGAPGVAYADQQFAALDDEQRVAARRLPVSMARRS